jgi:hypothetical protein
MFVRLYVTGLGQFFHVDCRQVARRAVNGAFKYARFQSTKQIIYGDYYMMRLGNSTANGEGMLAQYPLLRRQAEDVVLEQTKPPNRTISAYVLRHHKTPQLCLTQLVFIPQRPHTTRYLSATNYNGQSCRRCSHYCSDTLPTCGSGLYHRLQLRFAHQHLSDDVRRLYFCPSFEMPCTDA